MRCNQYHHASISLLALLALVQLAATGCLKAPDQTAPGDTPVFTGVPTPPEGWSYSVGSQSGIGLATSDKHGGTSSLYITGPASTVSVSSASPGILSQFLRADTYRGKRVRFAAWVKPLNVKDASYAGLWMRIDGPGTTQGFDNMGARPVTGTGDWREISIVLDVPQHAIGIAMGVLFNAHNTLLLDDMRLEVVGNTVPTTASVTATASTVDSATTANTYARNGNAPTNLDFEGMPGPSAATVDWLTQNAVALSTTDPTASLDDLEPLRAMIGSAHLVGLGEGTHGTREFFLMKHRILEFLVTRMGFTHFAIEATTPEADDMNRYVLTGEGDPVKLLSHLYFWTWNTEEVLDMVHWMRQWNASAPVAQRVQFLGFDMQAPGASMDSVSAFLTVVDAAARADAATRYACLGPYRNNGPIVSTTVSQYATLADNVKSACAAGLKAVFDNISSRRSQYEAASSPSRFAVTLHHARLVQQYETMIATTNGTTNSRSRDASMAENIGWIRDQAGPNAKVVLWAHNGHINAVPLLMGGYLRASYGSDYVNLGFAFGHGSFSAVGQTGSTFTGLATWTASLIPKSSIEAAFDGTGKPRLLLDTRRIASGGSAALPLAGPITMRSIGATFNQSIESAYFASQRFPDDFDLLIYLANTNASVRLPFVY